MYFCLPWSENNVLQAKHPETAMTCLNNGFDSESTNKPCVQRVAVQCRPDESAGRPARAGRCVRTSRVQWPTMASRVEEGSCQLVCLHQPASCFRSATGLNTPARFNGPLWLRGPCQPACTHQPGSAAHCGFADQRGAAPAGVYAPTRFSGPLLASRIEEGPCQPVCTHQPGTCLTSASPSHSL
jgi:hypothetical protein